MDSVTHIAIGAVIGQAQLGKRLGYKAALWGAAISTLPDLDVLLYPFLTSAQQLQFHRGITHSLFFLLLTAPVLGWVISRLHRKEKPGWKASSWLSFWALLSHLLIDVPTSYGTQILEPFSNQRFTTDSIFIIDPLFTLIFLAGIAIPLIQPPDSLLRKWATRLSLILGALYLAWGLSIKHQVHQIFKSSFVEQYGNFERIKTIPGPFTNLMWTGHIERNDSLYTSTYSVFDSHTDLHFQGVSKRTDLLKPYLEDSPVDVLLWFSMGWFKVEHEPGEGLYLHDLRFGRSDYWLQEDAEYNWTNRLIFNDDSTKVIDFDRSIPLLDSSIENRRRLWHRFWGKPPADSEGMIRNER